MADPNPMTCDQGSRVYDPDPETVIPDPIYLVTTVSIGLDELEIIISLYFEIRFIDSFKFLQTSLANLVGNLQPDDFYNTKEIFKENVNLLTRKGVYP